MRVLKTLVNTQYELNIAKTRLDYLLGKKEEIYTKYFPITSKIKDVPVQSSTKDNDKMALYLAELNDVNEITGKSLEQEIEEQRNEVNLLRYYINLMNNNLENLTGIEYEIYKNVVVKGFSITKSVEKVAEKYNKEPSTIWHVNYPRIKKELKKIIK